MRPEGRDCLQDAAEVVEARPVWSRPGLRQLILTVSADGSTASVRWRRWLVVSKRFVRPGSTGDRHRNSIASTSRLSVGGAGPPWRRRTRRSVVVRRTGPRVRVRGVSGRSGHLEP